MKAELLLRATSIISLVFAAGHTFGGTKSWSPMGETEVLHAMRTVQFEAHGVTRSYLDFYLGFGFILSVYLLLQAVVLWQLVAIAKTDSLRTRPFVASFFVASVASAVLAWKFIFAIPAVFSTVIAACLGVSFYAAGQQPSTQ